MAKSTLADARAAIRIRNNITNDLSGRAVARNSADPGQVIQIQVISRTPRDHVIRARRVSADADRPHHHLPLTIKRESAAEDVPSADFDTHHWVDGPCHCGPATLRTQR